MAHDERLAGEEEEAAVTLATMISNLIPCSLQKISPQSTKALSEEDRCIRACCEEIAAARYEVSRDPIVSLQRAWSLPSLQAETVISSWRAEDAVLEVDAQEAGCEGELAAVQGADRSS